MGKTYKKQSRRFDDDYHGGRGGSHRHVSGRKTGGMPIINSVVEDDYDDPFEDDLIASDEIFIEHKKYNA